MRSISDTFELNNGVKIPCVGFGTYKAAANAASESVKAALDAGYRHIDTAAVYGNEKEVGAAVRGSGIDRGEIFVTSKVWNSDQGYSTTKRAFERSLEDLGLEYLDLYLIHWPRVNGAEDRWAELNRETWRAMEELYAEGRIKAIGVSNFKPHHIDSLMDGATVTPAVNQIELFPGFPQDETVGYCVDNGILVEAWGPFSQGRLFRSRDLEDMAGRYGKTIAQLCLRWHLQRGILPLPKSVTPSHIVENSRIFDFEISDEDMGRLSSLDGVVGSGMDPDVVAW